MKTNLARRNSLVSSLCVGVHAEQGRRSSMEDVHKLILWEQIRTDPEVLGENRKEETCNGMLKRRFSISYQGETNPIDGDWSSKVSFFAVCDGHGGKQAAEFVNSMLFKHIVNQPNFLTDPVDATLKGFNMVEHEFSILVKENQLDGMIGTTVTAAILLGNKLIIANIGDSEAVLCSGGEAKVITECHSTNNAQERTRVAANGGVLVTDRVGNCRLGHPVWNPYFVNIAVTRSIGDLYFKCKEYVGEANSGLISIPSINLIELTHDDQFLIIASDGFWDTITPKQAIDYVLPRIDLNCETICQDLVKLSKGSESADNVTVILVKLKDSVCNPLFTNQNQK